MCLTLAVFAPTPQSQSIWLSRPKLFIIWAFHRKSLRTLELEHTNETPFYFNSETCSHESVWIRKRALHAASTLPNFACVALHQTPRSIFSQNNLSPALYSGHSTCSLPSLSTSQRLASRSFSLPLTWCMLRVVPCLYSVMFRKRCCVFNTPQESPPASSGRVFWNGLHSSTLTVMFCFIF